MNCSEVQELLSAYYDGELADDQRDRVSAHIGTCTKCAGELTGFEKLSRMASVLSEPVPTQQIWSQINQKLDEQSICENPILKPDHNDRRLSFSVPKLFVLAATILTAVGISWFTYQSWFTHGNHVHFTAVFSHYLDEFVHDPDAAQQILLGKYENKLIDPNRAVEQIGYRPSVANGLPAEYTLESTHVIKMPCCTCVQSICKRNDGSKMAIFEHDDKETKEWFGDRPNISVYCKDKQCCLVELDKQIAASWKQGSRHITLIGVQDVAEVNEIISWLNEKKQPVLN
ncbi:zf-HC2 domain-containing protein [Gimesia maris]|uniref:zf-HC2 domain-containing protein n=1 Tax=Gimesia maris TaxID=122 RepID=UPI0032EC4C81